MARVAVSRLVAQMCPTLRAPPHRARRTDTNATYLGRAHNCRICSMEQIAVLNLRQGVEAGQVHLAAFFFGELGSQQERPVIELFADDLRAQPVGRYLQCRSRGLRLIRKILTSPLKCERFGSDSQTLTE